MGSVLAVTAAMRTLGLLMTLMAMSPQATIDQKAVVPDGTTITSAQVTGFDVDRLSPGPREAIRNLAGTPLNQQRVDELAARIEAERPRYVAAVRTVMDPDGQARVFFVAGRRDQPDREDNINARYVVEHAEITGVPDALAPLRAAQIEPFLSVGSRRGLVWGHLTGDQIAANAIPLEVRSPRPARAAAGLQEVRDSAERERIRQALQQTDWNVSAAARLLGTERTALHKRLRALGVKQP